MKILFKGFNYSQDGPGNRLVYHLQGCNFRCQWCANPESMDPTAPGKYEMTPEEIVREAESCRMMFFDGGGVTFTGGEPTLWHGELKICLRGLREAGISTALETNGSDPRLGELLPDVDFLMIDLKIPDRENHLRRTGADNAVTLENIRKIAESGRQATVRIPLIHGVNTDPAAFADFFRELPSENLKAEILPYHEFGKGKWKEPYQIENGFVTKEEREELERALAAVNVAVIAT